MIENMIIQIKEKVEEGFKISNKIIYDFIFETYNNFLQNY